MEKYNKVLEYLEKVLLDDANKDKILDHNFRANTLEEGFKEVFNVSIKNDLIPRVTKYVENNAEKISLNFINIAPYNDYEKLTYDKAEIVDFLRKECSKPENWKVKQISPDSIANIEAVKITFYCSALGENERDFEAFSFVSNSGSVKYTFAVYNGK